MYRRNNYIRNGRFLPIRARRYNNGITFQRRNAPIFSRQNQPRSFANVRFMRRRPIINRRRNMPVRRRNINTPNIPNSQFVSGRNLNQSFRNQSYEQQVVTKEEKWFDVQKGVRKIIFKPGKSGVPHLDRIASIYEMFQARHVRISYKPSSGTTIPGNLTMGMDYNANNERLVDDISLCQPNRSGAIFTPHSMVAVQNRIMKGKTWLYTDAGGTNDPDSNCFALYVNADTDADQVGQIWIQYTFAFSGPTSPTGTAITAVQQPVLTMNTTLADTALTSQPEIQKVAHEGVNDWLEVYEPTQTIKVEPSGESDPGTTTLESAFEIKEDMPINEPFTLGTAIQSETSTQSYFRSSIARTPTITFKYIDGTPVPPGVVAPLNTPVRYSGRMQSDIFASIFELLKPIAKPIVGTIIDILSPLSQSPAYKYAFKVYDASGFYENGVPFSQFMDENFFNFSSEELENFSQRSFTDYEFQNKRKAVAKEEDFFLKDQEIYSCFSFMGDTAQITQPILNVEPPITAVDACAAAVVSFNENDFTWTLKEFRISPQNSWLNYFEIIGDGYGAIYEMTLQHPNTSTPSFHSGDIIHLTFTAMSCTLPITNENKNSNCKFIGEGLSDFQISVISNFKIMDSKGAFINAPISVLSVDESAESPDIFEHAGYQIVLRIGTFPEATGTNTSTAIQFGFKAGPMVQCLPGWTYLSTQYGASSNVPKILNGDKFTDGGSMGFLLFNISIFPTAVEFDQPKFTQPAFKMTGLPTNRLDDQHRSKLTDDFMQIRL